MRPWPSLVHMILLRAAHGRTQGTGRDVAESTAPNLWSPRNDDPVACGSVDWQEVHSAPRLMGVRTRLAGAALPHSRRWLGAFRVARRSVGINLAGCRALHRWRRCGVLACKLCGPTRLSHSSRVARQPLLSRPYAQDTCRGARCHTSHLRRGCCSSVSQLALPVERAGQLRGDTLSRDDGAGDHGLSNGLRAAGARCGPRSQRLPRPCRSCAARPSCASGAATGGGIRGRLPPAAHGPTSRDELRRGSLWDDASTLADICIC